MVRFAAQLGYDGYPEMQKALQELIRGKLTSIQRIQVSRDQMSGADILGSVMQRDMNSIHNVIEQLDRDAFSRAVDKLLGAEHIYILGVRSSSFLAGYLNFYLHLIFKNVTLVQSSAAGEIYEQLAHIGRGDVLVGIILPAVLQDGYPRGGVCLPAGRGGGGDHRFGTVSAVRHGGGIAAGALRHDLLRGLHGCAAEPAERADPGGGAADERDDLSATLADMEQVWSRYSIFGKDGRVTWRRRSW